MQKKSLYFLLLKVLKFPLGILTLSLTVKQFGVSMEMDSWLIALAGVTMIGLAVWGSINETFRSRFVILKETEGETAALDKVRSLLFYILIFSMLGVIVIWCYPQLPAKLFSAENFQHSETLLLMFQLLAPYLLLNQCVAICTSILNAYEVFYTPEISSAISQVINIVLILLFANQLGIYVLVIALYLSVLLLLLLLLYKLKRLNIQIIKWSIPNTEGIRVFFIYSIPFLIPYFFGQLNGMIEKKMATKLGVGAVSVLDFSKKIPDILNGVIISLVLTILVPTLTKFYVNQQKDNYQKAFVETYSLGLFFLVCFVTLFFAGADEILMLLYGGKRLDMNRLQEIVFMSKLFAISLFGVFSYIVFGMTMLSINKGKVYAFWGTIAQIISIIMNFLLVDYLGIIIFPITFFIAHIVSAIFMFCHYPYERKYIVSTSIKYYLYSMVCCATAYLSLTWFRFSNSTFLDKVFVLIFKGGLVLLIIFLFGILFRIDEIRKVKYFVLKKFEEIKKNKEK